MGNKIYVGTRGDLSRDIEDLFGLQNNNRALSDSQWHHQGHSNLWETQPNKEIISSVLVYLTHEWFRSVRGSPDLKIFYVGLSFVFSHWITISVRSNLLTVLFRFFLELLGFIYCVYQLLTELYKCSTLVVDFSVSPCGLLSFCFNVLMLCYSIMTV